MKNNMRKKLIIVGESGAGKSYKALSMALDNKGTTIICNGSTGVNHYRNDFLSLNTFIPKDNKHCFTIHKDNKYFIESTAVVSTSDRHSAEFLSSLILGCDYGDIGKDKNAMAVFDDGSWENIENKIETLWKLSHTDCQIIITCRSLDDLLDIKLDDDMRRDILKYWGIITVCKLNDKWFKRI